MKLPSDTGYSVDTEGFVHRRHPAHANQTIGRTRTPAGVDALLQGKRGRTCRECYPLPPRALPDVQAPAQGQQRRVSQDGHVQHQPSDPPTTV
jgi:hypothetical protein